MYLSTTITPPVDKWRLMYQQIMNDNTVKHRCKYVKYVFYMSQKLELLTNAAH